LKRQKVIEKINYDMKKSKTGKKRLNPIKGGENLEKKIIMRLPCREGLIHDMPRELKPVAVSELCAKNGNE
jgi:hypothetical protein